MSVAQQGLDARLHTYTREPLEIVNGRGSVLYDGGGNAYIDLLAGIAVASVGHSHPRLVQAIAEQAASLIHVSNLYDTRPQIELARRLAELTGGMRSFFCNSGAEAVETALKILRKWGGTQRPRIIAMKGAFHGRTFGALSATGQSSKREPFEPLLDDFLHVPYDDLDALAQAMDGTVAGVIVEPIQGEAGVIVPEPGYLRGVAELCEGHGAMFVLDEVQTGVARTGSWFAHQEAGVTPDVMCLAKGLAGGLPIGVCLAGSRAAEVLVPGDHASTFGGGPVPCAAALAVLDIIESDGLIERARATGETLRRGLADLFGEEKVRGIGLLLGVTVPEGRAADVVTTARERRLLIGATGPSDLRFSPPLVITDEEVESALTILEEVWREVGAT